MGGDAVPRREAECQDKKRKLSAGIKRKLSSRTQRRPSASTKQEAKHRRVPRGARPEPGNASLSCSAGAGAGAGVRKPQNIIGDMQS